MCVSASQYFHYIFYEIIIILILPIFFYILITWHLRMLLKSLDMFVPNVSSLYLNEVGINLLFFHDWILSIVNISLTLSLINFLGLDYLTVSSAYFNWLLCILINRLYLWNK